MKKWLGAGALLALVLVGLALSGVVPIPGREAATHPPCDQLPSVAEVATALAENARTVEQLEALATGIEVQSSQPCADDETRALIEVVYPSADDRDKIESFLQREDGFGVPLELTEN